MTSSRHSARHEANSDLEIFSHELTTRQYLRHDPSSAAMNLSFIRFDMQPPDNGEVDSKVKHIFIGGTSENGDGRWAQWLRNEKNSTAMHSVLSLISALHVFTVLIKFSMKICDLSKSRNYY